MSILDELNYRCEDGRLHRLTLGTDEPEPRAIWVTPQINRLLTGPWWNTRQAVRWAYVRNDLAGFIRGDIVTLAVPGKRPSSHTLMARLIRPSSPEVWEIRCLDPDPSLRLFGRFAARNKFVAFRVWRRWWLGPFGSRAWRAASVQCTTDWRNLFPSYDPHTSEDYPNGYVSDPQLL